MSGRVPPSSRAARARRSIRGTGFADDTKAARRIERFTGHDPEELGIVEYPDLDGVAVAVVGRCDGVLYSTTRDGKAEKYIHEFAPADAPMLAVTADGRQLLLIGGRYLFGSRGIVDKSRPNG